MSVTEFFDTYPWVANLVRGAVALVITWIVARLVRRMIRRFVDHLTREESATDEEEKERRQTIGIALRAVATFFVWSFGILLALAQAGVNIGPLIAAAGIGGVAIGFGAQNLVRDMLSGFFILLEDQFHVGDVIEVAGVSGTVERISIRSTTLRDLHGAVHTVPNGEITVTSNFTHHFSRYVMDLPVAYDDDVDLAIATAERVVEAMRSEETYGSLIRDFKVLGVDEYGASEVLVKTYVETLPGRQWEVGRELRKRVKAAYDEAGLSIPFPTRELHIKQADGE